MLHGAVFSKSAPPGRFFFVLQCQAEQGFKNIKNFTSLDYDLLSQNWCITRDTRGVIYAANQGGVLEYDGVTWQTIDVPHHEKEE
ncbi:MAG: hypothetical protein PVH61_23945 [Candidatus Aminicenantes bacterium]|jgi:hypothetical protein